MRDDARPVARVRSLRAFETYERERILPVMLMLTAMRPTSDRYKTNDPASWSDWEQCVRKTLSEIPFPELSPLMN
jgi:hypothetical protein